VIEPDPHKEAPVGSRALLGATIAAAIISGAGLFAVGTLPAASETGPQLVAWLRDHRHGVQWFVWTITISTPPFALAFSVLRRFLPAPYRDMYLIGAITALIMNAVQAWTWGGLALHADQLEPATARAVLDVAVFFGPVATGATTTMMAPVTLLALRGQAGLPRWLGLLGAIAFVEQAVETITIFGSTGFTQPGGAMNLQLGAALTLAWIFGFALWGAFRGRAWPEE
jgi:hypothetical protein